MSSQFWTWFFFGLNSKPGWRSIINRWITLHICLGLLIACIVDQNLNVAASTALLPLAGILIGLTFAWAGNAQSLLMVPEIELLSKHHADGIEAYIYPFQLAILVILTALVIWLLVALNAFETPLKGLSDKLSENWRNGINLCLEAALYAFASLIIRECWQVVVNCQNLLLTRKKVRDEVNKIKQRVE